MPDKDKKKRTNKKRCNYCFRECNKVSLVNLRQGKLWLNQVISVCDSCREYLHGRYRYTKGGDANA